MTHIILTRGVRLADEGSPVAAKPWLRQNQPLRFAALGCIQQAKARHTLIEPPWGLTR